jgi:hypothetical protein
MQQSFEQIKEFDKLQEAIITIESSQHMAHVEGLSSQNFAENAACVLRALCATK